MEDETQDLYDREWSWPPIVSNFVWTRSWTINRNCFFCLSWTFSRLFWFVLWSLLLFSSAFGNPIFLWVCINLVLLWDLFLFLCTNLWFYTKIDLLTRVVSLLLVVYLCQCCKNYVSCFGDWNLWDFRLYDDGSVSGLFETLSIRIILVKVIGGGDASIPKNVRCLFELSSIERA